MQYTVVECRECSELIKKVNELLKQGWEPAGGMCYVSTYSNYLQALIKK